MQTDGKRNIQALKNSIKGRKKREIGGETEINEPVFQNGPVDYEELLQTLNDDFPYAEKRFLGMYLLYLTHSYKNIYLILNTKIPNQK